MSYSFREFEYIFVDEYKKIIFFLCFLLFFVLVLLGAALLLSVKSYDVEKNSPYECGFNPFEDAREPFEIHFYLVSILFIIFDLEISFLVPWVAVYRFIGLGGFFFLSVFLGLLTLGFVYEVFKGGLDWN